MSELIGHLDCSTGVSGDKLLGAVLDVGTRLKALDLPGFDTDDLRRLMATLAPEATVVVERGASCGISALRLRIAGPSEPHSRSWAQIAERVEGADLDDNVRATSLAVFERLARAEATAHGVAPENVRFHEVGGLDSILDVVGTVAGLDAIGLEFLAATPIATGFGTVATSHGILPVPAPATAELLLDIPTVPGPATPDHAPIGELTTPTGAALVTELASNFGIAPPLTPTAIGYGAGTRDVGLANVCRLIVGDLDEDPWPPIQREKVVLLETNLDHLSPEQASYALDELLAEGALDAWITPIVMKKGRSAVLLSVLTLEEFAEDTAARVIALTGSLGVRRTGVDRSVAERAIIEVETPWGTVCAKVGASRVRPEHDDVARIAREHALPYGFVRDEIERLARDRTPRTE
ncbi:MAG: nickel pincer cofactor biosynthesis protein LarC [Coriobacteriales bacterium]|nr:nickel pincer cofactor biosynthesis protein LarC [Coriobacteriales bacterium]